MEATTQTITTARYIQPAEQATLLVFYAGGYSKSLRDLIHNAMASYSDEYAENPTMGHWHGYDLSSGVFYLAPPARDKPYAMMGRGNFYDGEMSADAAGIVACLMAFSHLACHTEEDHHIEMFHGLREWALDHPEAGKIMAAID